MACFAVIVGPLDLHTVFEKIIQLCFGIIDSTPDGDAGYNELIESGLAHSYV
jgi:hypothetical protein